MDGYKIFYEGVSEGNFHGIVIYVSKDLTVTQMEPNIPFRECLLLRIEMAVGDTIIFGTFYRSPNTNCDNDSELLRLISYLNENYKEQLIAVGDFNFSNIDWQSWTGILMRNLLMFYKKWFKTVCSRTN